MTTAIAFLLAATSLISVGGLAILIWALANDQSTMGPRAARTILGSGEVGKVEDSATPPEAKLKKHRERGEVPPPSAADQETLAAIRGAQLPSRGRHQPIVY
ncbi:MAG: hypothetical protein AAGA44_01820 [Pseudomonadota bacterium]